MKIKKGDNVLVITGKDRGRKGKILGVLSRGAKVIVEGMNIKKKHVRPKKAGEKGQIVQLPAPFSISNIQLICGKCGKATRAEYRIQGDKKYRICKKCRTEV